MIVNLQRDKEKVPFPMDAHPQGGGADCPYATCRSLVGYLWGTTLFSKIWLYAYYKLFPRYFRPAQAVNLALLLSRADIAKLDIDNKGNYILTKNGRQISHTGISGEGQD